MTATLELKIPPPAVALLVAAAMWFAAPLTPVPGIPPSVRIAIAVLVALLGGAVSLAGTTSFRRARTTVNPMKPDRASSLVTSGVYRWTRNPMYLGLLLVLVGWAAFLSSPLAFAGPVVFFLYIGRFQIAPEERALSSLFGAEFASYKDRVRRWI